MLTRRQFIQLSAVAGGALLLPGGVTIRPAFAQAEGGPIPGGSLDPGDIDKYVTPLVIPPAMPRSGVKRIKGGTAVDWYDIAVRQFDQHILPDAMPMTTVWSYGSVRTPATFNYPAFTVEARYRRPVAVRWRNELVDDRGHYLPHLLTVDPTLHWANPPGGTEGRDSRPTFSSTPAPYTGPVPIVTHLHGSEAVGDESDGYAEAWWLPDAKDIPNGYATEGTWRSFFQQKFLNLYGSADMTAWAPGSSTFVYPNDQRASTLWYHDHTLGMTRLNVYAGPAGFWIVRGGPDDRVRDTRTGAKAVLPGPSPRRGDRKNTRYYEIPIVIQDRSFDDDGSLFYATSRAFFDGWTGPYIGSDDSDVPPYWNPEFFGNTMVVNGRTWPYLATERRRYRFRFLNGCDSRVLVLRFDDPRVKVWLIGTEGGFLPAPLLMNDIDPYGKGCATILLALAERADVIADFTDVPNRTEVLLTNIGPDDPYGGGLPDEDFDVSDPNTTGQVMQFRVVPAVDHDDSTPAEYLRLPRIHDLGSPDQTRELALLERMSEVADGPVAALLGVVEHGRLEERMWSDPVTEDPKVGDTEVWEIYNSTADAHPIHIHETFFQVVNRQALEVDEDGEVVQPVRTAGAPRPPDPWEDRAWKDTVLSYPGEVTRVKLRFRRAGNYVWHCHIVSHEDNEMMRPYRIGPVQPGSPEDAGST
jgi:spore coat protein A